MSAKIEELLKELLKEQKRTSLYTLTLERDRFLAALVQAGLGVPVMAANEFILAAGATANIIQAVPAGFVYILAGPGVWHTSLPWWCSYDFWVDQTAPAAPLATATRMPAELSTPDFQGIMAGRAFLLHVVTNNHALTLAYGMIQNAFVAVSTETWDMIKATFMDPLVADVRRMAQEISGIKR